MHIKRDAISGLDHSTSPPTYIACHLTTSNIHTKSSSMLSAIFLISMIAIQCQASPLTLMRRAYGEGGCQEDPSSDRIIDAWSAKPGIEYTKETSKPGQYENWQCMRQVPLAVGSPCRPKLEDCINLYEKMKAVGKADGNLPYVRVEYAKDEDNVIGYRKHLRAYNEASLEDDLPLSEGTCSIRFYINEEDKPDQNFTWQIAGDEIKTMLDMGIKNCAENPDFTDLEATFYIKCWYKSGNSETWSVPGEDVRKDALPFLMRIAYNHADSNCPNVCPAGANQGFCYA